MRVTRAGALTTALIMGACLVPEHGQAATLHPWSEHTPDGDGTYVDAELSSIASGIVGRPYSIRYWRCNPAHRCCMTRTW